MLKTMLVGMMILACASLAAAQSGDYKKVEAYGGYSRHEIGNDLDDNDVVVDPESFHGFNTSITGNISRYFGLKFDFAGHFKSRPIPFGPLFNGIDVDSRRYTSLGGLQIKNNSTEATFKPFVHALVGAAHIRNRVKINDDLCIAIAPTPCPADFTEKDTGFAAALGGGVDIRASDRIDVRIFQVDYLPTRLFDGRQQTLRLGIGIVFH